MAQRATSLGPKPSLFFFVFLLFFLVFVFFGGGCFLGGFKGQVRWPKRATSLVLLLFFCCFPFFVFAPKAIVVYLSVFPFVSL